MSFYSLQNAETQICPGAIRGDVACGITERICVSVKKVYDACVQQEQLNNVRLCLCNIQPCNIQPVAPFEFVSCRSNAVRARIRDLRIDRLTNREHFARVRGTVEIPVDVVFVDANNREFTGKAIIAVAKDVILFVPDESIIPFTVDNIVSAICVTGTFVSDNCFDVSVCVTIIIKIVAEVDVLIPAFGFCTIPPCEEFAENVCDEFFGLPLFPPQFDNSGIGAGTINNNCGCCR